MENEFVGLVVFVEELCFIIECEGLLVEEC